MPRPLWKGKSILSKLYNYSLVRPTLEVEEKFPIKLYRRNHFVTHSFLAYIQSIKVSLYNGYDFFIKDIEDIHVNRNLSQIISTREINVVHKTKLSKHAKKNLQKKSTKKKLLTGASINNRIKRKTNIKKKL